MQPMVVGEGVEGATTLGSEVFVSSGEADGGVPNDDSAFVGSLVTGAEVGSPADGSAVIGSVVTNHSVKSGGIVGWSVGSSSAIGSTRGVESSRVTSLSTS